MKPSVRRACLSGVVATALFSGMLGTGVASASTELVAGGLAAPTGLTPDDENAAYPHAVLKTVRLNWSPVAGATSYRVQVGRDSSWSDTPILTQDVLASELTLPVSLPHATYVWRVAALKDGALGHWTSEEGRPQAEAQFTRGWRDLPTPVAPSGAQGGVGLPEFSWSPVPDASAYEVQVSDTDFNVSPSPTPTQSPDTSPSPSTQTQPRGAVDTCYTVRTRVTFFTEHVQHGESNTGPCSSTLIGGGQQLYWRVRPLDRFTDGGTSGSTTPGAASITYSAPSGTPTPAIDGPCPGDTGGGCAPNSPSDTGTWSVVTPFSWTRVAPGTFDPATLVATHTLANDPDDVCTVGAAASTAEHATCVDMPTIAWDAAPGAVFYRVTIGLDDQFSNVQRLVDTPGLQWTPTDSWPDATAGTSYYYVVQACSNTVCGAVTPTPPSFSKATPRPALGSVPPVSGEFRLSWQSYADSLAAVTALPETQDAYAYHVQVARADHPSFDVTVDDVTVDQTYYVPNKSYGDGNFVWRVQPVDSAQHLLPFSRSQAFTRDATPPRVLSVTPNSKVAVNAALKLVFSEPVTGLSSSSVTLSPFTPTTLSVTGSTTATLVPSTPLRPGGVYTVTVSSAVKDLVGNVAVAVGPTVSVNGFVDDKNVALAYSSGWHLLSASNAVGGTYHGSVPTTSVPTSVTLKFAGRGVTLVGCVGPAFGYLDVYIDSVKVGRASSYRTFSGCDVKLGSVTGLPSGNHTLRLVGTGTHPAGAKGNAVGIDAVGITP